MSGYVDGFVLPIPRRNLPAYLRLSRLAGRVWKDHGALEYRECSGDDIARKGKVSFPLSVKLKPGETVFFSWIVYRSRAHRDRVNARVMKDPRLLEMMDPKSHPFDLKRMMYGGFKIVVDQ